MGSAYLWADMLETSAFYGIGMSAALLILFAFVYRKRRKFGAILALVVTLVLGLLGGSCWMLYQATLSTERDVLDRVDRQIMHIEKLRVQACISMNPLPQAAEADREHFEQILDTSRAYLRELEQPIVDVTDLEWLNANFRVGEAPSLSKNTRIAYAIGGVLGLFHAVIMALLASGYLTLRLCFQRETVMDVGALMAGAVLIGSCVLMYGPTGDLNPLVVTLLIPVVAAMLLHYCSRRESVRLLEITGGIFLILSVGLYSVSSWAIVSLGEDDVRKNITAMNTRLPNVVQRSKRLGETIDSLKETGRYDEDGSVQFACHGLRIELGGLLERIGY